MTVEAMLLQGIATEICVFSIFIILFLYWILKELRKQGEQE